MYLGKKDINILANAVDRLTTDLSRSRTQDQRRNLKGIIFGLIDIKDKASDYRDHLLAHQKETRFHKVRVPHRFCCVCRYRRPIDLMRRLTEYEHSSIFKIGRANQWICNGSHRTPHKK